MDKMPSESTRIIKTHLPIEFLPDNIENESKVSFNFGIFEYNFSCNFKVS